MHLKMSTKFSPTSDTIDNNDFDQLQHQQQPQPQPNHDSNSSVILMNNNDDQTFNPEEIICNDDDDDDNDEDVIDEMQQQLTFTSNKTFPLDLHYHHRLIHGDLQPPSSPTSYTTPATPAIDTIIPLFQQNFQYDDDVVVGEDIDDRKSVSPKMIRPPPPSPRTPPLEQHVQNGEMCLIDDNVDDGSSPPPYHRFETATITTTDTVAAIYQTNYDQNEVRFDYIDSQLTIVDGDNMARKDAENLQNDDNSKRSSLCKQISHSALAINLGPPEFDQLFGDDQAQSYQACSKQQYRQQSHQTPTPYARLIHFKQHQQHLVVPSPTASASSTLLRRRSLPTRSFSTFFSNRQQQPSSAQMVQSSSSNQTMLAAAPPSPNTPPFLVAGGKEKRLGHRRVNEEGQVTYKKIKSTQLMYSIQLGIGYSVGSMASKPERDLLMRDFMQIETVHFPKSGSQITPAHHYTDFTFSTYTPFAFRYFRDLFRIQPDDFMLSITNESLQELSNPGASGSMFFRTKDDQFIIKTVEKQEAKFLLKLLPGYYMNLSQNPHTLLPKFFGLYCYECIGKNIRILVMNNLLPSNIRLHQKYDLKGSTYKRKANQDELKKSSPIFKDLDFMEHYYSEENRTLITHFSKIAELTSGDLRTQFPMEGGLLLEAHVYDELIGTLQRDCRVLQSFEIMDYSLLIGVHNYDFELKKNFGQKSFDYDNDDELPTGAIRAMNIKGERLLLFMGIIDILQSYRLVKKVEHAWKSILYDGKAISVTRPDFYAKRFLDFMCKKVFGRLQPDNHQLQQQQQQQQQQQPGTSLLSASNNVNSEIGNRTSLRGSYNNHHYHVQLTNRK